MRLSLVSSGAIPFVRAFDERSRHDRLPRDLRQANVR